MKKKCLFTPEQKEVVLEYVNEFGNFFVKKGFAKSKDLYQFCKRFETKPLKRQSAQLGVVFAYCLLQQDYDYFKRNHKTNYQQYLINSTTQTWSGFAKYISVELQKLKSNEEVQGFCEDLHNEIIS